ncbi:hypothetical protein GBAR_LOCUS25631 [Geodia barretti]|uniref:Uncharacterized protein n=1 Tax=Geodia barretti TaxID=519541 RepID=A0AA35TEY1_GEOBA|nr:hypothetical protein GBAR_LOCUS25631 [Geodia barretti]
MSIGMYGTHIFVMWFLRNYASMSYPTCPQMCLLEWEGGRSKVIPISHTHHFPLCCRSSADLPSEELSDDYDDELEQFKKICFAAPVVNRKRIAVSLDMNDLMAKMK